MNTTDCADELIALINSSPRSPRRDEIEAVLTKYKAAWVLGERERALADSKAVTAHNMPGIMAPTDCGHPVFTIWPKPDNQNYMVTFGNGKDLNEAALVDAIAMLGDVTSWQPDPTAGHLVVYPGETVVMDMYGNTTQGTDLSLEAECQRQHGVCSQELLEIATNYILAIEEEQEAQKEREAYKARVAELMGWAFPALDTETKEKRDAAWFNAYIEKLERQE